RRGEVDGGQIVAALIGAIGLVGGPHAEAAGIDGLRPGRNDPAAIGTGRLRRRGRGGEQGGQDEGGAAHGGQPSSKRGASASRIALARATASAGSAPSPNTAADSAAKSTPVAATAARPERSEPA